MKNMLLPALLAATLVLAGCQSTSDEEKATMDRFQMMDSITTEMDTLGYQKITLMPGVDEFINIAASIAERQKTVMHDYRTQAESYADVQAFLYAHREAEPAQLQEAIVAFDAGAQTDDEKIGPKIAAYQEATESVKEANAALFTEILIEGAKAAFILAQYNGDIAQAMALAQVGSFLSGEEQTAENNLYLAFNRAKDHIALSTEASELISIDEETINAINALQVELEAKS